jgi:EAL and modified HD-GYP domain-containing signal transduction protein
MEEYVARQAVFDQRLRVIGYELLFRSGPENFFSGSDGDRASLRVIEQSLNTFGVGRLAVGGKGWINVTRRMLTEGVVSVLPARTTVLELLSSVEPGPEVLVACGAYKRQGYTLALDDYRSGPGRGPFLGLADILKVDFRTSEPQERSQIARSSERAGARLLAKKVETREEMLEAVGLGYTLFQGYFFCKPEILSRREIPAYKLSYLRFVGEVNRGEADFDELERLIRQDVALSVKLLRFINSAQFSLAVKVESIRQALALVGLAQMRKWVSLLAMAAMADDRPDELIVTSLVRAAFCEKLGDASGRTGSSNDLFLVGMLSLIDTVLGRSMTEILEDLPLSEAIKAALLDGTGEEGRILALAVAYERAQWDRIPALLAGGRIELEKIPRLYREAVAWADQIFQASNGKSTSTRNRPS